MKITDDIPRIDKLSSAWLWQKLHVNPAADTQRRALSYVFHSVEGSYFEPAKPRRLIRAEALQYIYENLELRSRVFEQFVDSIFPDHEKQRRDALSIALICDGALRQASERKNETVAFGGFDEDTVELAIMIYEEAQDLMDYGTKAINAGIEPESLFLAHINAIDALSVIESDYALADPKILKKLDRTFFEPVSEFLEEGYGIGRHVRSYMDSVQRIVNDHLSGFFMPFMYDMSNIQALQSSQAYTQGQQLIPDNDLK